MRPPRSCGNDAPSTSSTLRVFIKLSAPCIVVRIARPTHADGDFVVFKLLDVVSARILNAAIRVVNQSCCRLALLQCRFERLLSKAAVQLPTDAPAPPRVANRRPGSPQD